MTRMKKTTLAFGIALALGTSATQAQTSLTLSNWVPPNHFVSTDILGAWAEEVTEATEGRVQIRMLPSAVGSPEKHWELARLGVVDITWGNFTYEPIRFKSLWFAEMPLTGSNAVASSIALWDTIGEYMSDDPAYDGVKLLGVGLLGGGALHHGSQPVVDVSDLDNQKLRMGGPIQKELLEAFGAVPVAAPATRGYELLESGVVDGSLHPLESVIAFRLESQLEHHTLFPGGFYDATFFIGMNERKWDSLSDADQDAIMSVSGEHLSRLWGERFHAQNQAAEEELRRLGNQFHQPSDALLEKTHGIREAMLTSWFEEMQGLGYTDPTAIVDFYESRYQALDSE
ncbi:TRAP transporter substrate-binding protein [Saccharospirillum sp.]|uniref:TRAP transporter substrate-binding protein n=1 Tax=Saccharospirillum sp. TaxID=2033801 RepID=UPI0034A06688